MKIKSATIACVILVVCILVGCSVDRWSSVESGEYVVAREAGTVNAIALSEIQKLEIDRDEGVAVFTQVDGPEIVVAFVPRDKAVWPSGCPTNINATRMEVLDLEESPLTIGSITLSDPILVRGCPPDPPQVILREDGAIGGGGGACVHRDQCIFFEQGERSASVPVTFTRVPPATSTSSPAATSTAAPAPTPVSGPQGPVPTPVPMKTGPVVDIPGSEYGVVELNSLDWPACCLDVAPRGERLAFATCHTMVQKIYVQNVDGSGLKEINSLRTHDGDGTCPDPAWSPDGRQLAFANYDYGLNVVNADGTNLTRLEAKGMAPVWSPDGQEIAFTAHPSQHELVIGVMNRDGTDLRLLTNNEGGDQRPAWSPDGQHIAFVSDRDGNREIYVMNKDGSDQRRLTYNEAQDWGPVWSPDGRYIVFTSDRNGHNGIYVVNSDGTDERWLLDTDAPQRWPMDVTKVRFIEYASHETR